MKYNQFQFAAEGRRDPLKNRILLANRDPKDKKVSYNYDFFFFAKSYFKVVGGGCIDGLLFYLCPKKRLIIEKKYYMFSFQLKCSYCPYC